MESQLEAGRGAADQGVVSRLWRVSLEQAGVQQTKVSFPGCGESAWSRQGCSRPRCCVQAVESQLGAGRGAADQGVVSRQNVHPVRNHGGLCCGVGLAVRLHF